MNEGEIHYLLSGLKDLRELLEVVHEIKAETGMLPDIIKYRGARTMRYNREDARALVRGNMNEETYIKNNLIRV